MGDDGLAGPGESGAKTLSPSRPFSPSASGPIGSGIVSSVGKPLYVSRAGDLARADRGGLRLLKCESISSGSADISRSGGLLDDDDEAVPFACFKSFLMAILPSGPVFSEVDELGRLTRVAESGDEPRRSRATMAGEGERDDLRIGDDERRLVVCGSRSERD